MASSLHIVVLDIFPGDSYTLPSSPLLELNDQIDDGVRTITYNGTNTIEAYMNLLTLLEFFNNLDEPRVGERRLTVQLFAPTDLPGEYLASNVAEIAIDVLPLNDNDPVFSQDLYNGSVVEMSPIGTITGVIVMATDNDIYGDTSITYEIMPPNSNFFIDPVSGVILTNAIIDAEVDSFYSFAVVAMDNDGPQSRNGSATVYIEVIDVNDNPPVFNQSSYTVPVSESASVPSVILRLTAEDVDSSFINSDVRYEILPPEQGSGVPIDLLPESPSDPVIGVPFVIDSVTGEVSLSESLDYETTRQFSFRVQASDSGSPTMTTVTQVTVFVEDANDNIPQFTNAPYSVTLNESVPAPMNILTISAIDSDSGVNGEIRYSLSGTEVFAIDSVSGVVSLIMPLDYELQQSLNFTVIASDSGSPPQSAEQLASITILNVNDNPPQFSQDLYEFSILENSLLSVEVIATDEDFDQILFISSSGFSPYFELDSFTGVITNAQGFSLDYETQTQFELVVEATDGLFSSFANVTINILDQNDLEPAFISSSYSATINESLPIGSSVLQVRAVDGDSGSNAEIEYILNSSEGSVPFSINSQTGEIVVASALDFETLPISYTFPVIARNTVPPYFNDTTVVTIELIDTNDIRPMLSLDQTNIDFIENSEAKLIAANIVVTDADSADHPITMCSVILGREFCDSPGVDICHESVSVNETSATQLGLTISVLDEIENQTVVITGSASELIYQQVLASLEYANMAEEPLPGVRSVSIQCFDGDFASDILQISINVQLIDEFCPAIEASQLLFNYTEESGVLTVGDLARFALSDQDRAPHDTLMQLQVTLHNRLDGEYERIIAQDTSGLEIISSPDSIGSGMTITPDTFSIVVTGPANLPVYEQFLQTLAYENNRTEPTAGERQIEIAPINPAGNCSPLVLRLSIVLLNDNPPILVLVAANSVPYIEGSGDLSFASEAGLTITDADNNQLFPLQSSSVTLEGVLDSGMETLGYDTSMLSPELSVTNSANSSQLGLQFSGRATVQVYMAILRSLTYSNAAPEPTPGNRTVSITVSDGLQQDVTVVIVIVILADDNPLTLQVSTPQLVFTEGDVSLAVGLMSGVMLEDADREAFVENLTISLVGSQDQDNEFLLINASYITDEEIPDGAMIRISRRNSLANYQVRS